jgi:hypothetical protein
MIFNSIAQFILQKHHLWGIADKKQQARSHGMLNPSGDSPPLNEDLPHL